MAKKIAIMGAGSWGTALAVSLSHAGHQVNMWDINAEHIAEMRANRENKRYLRFSSIFSKPSDAALVIL